MTTSSRKVISFAKCTIPGNRAWCLNLSRLHTVVLEEDQTYSSIPAFANNIPAKAQLGIYMWETEEAGSVGLTEKIHPAIFVCPGAKI